MIKFLGAIVKDWIAAMSGGLGLLLTFVIAFFDFDNTRVQRGLYAASVVGILIAAYRVWSKEHGRAETLQASVDSRLPVLTGFLMQRLVGQYSIERHDRDGGSVEQVGYLLIECTVRIVNSGMVPTTIKNVNCHVETATGNGESGTFTEPVLHAPYENKLLEYIRNQIPLEPGTDVEGELGFKLPIWRQQFNDDSVVRFTVTDAWERTHIVTGNATHFGIGRKKKIPLVWK